MPTKGNPTLQIRMDEASLTRFEAAAHNAGTDRADLARRILAWWTGEDGVELPKRPPRTERGYKTVSDASGAAGRTP